METARLGRFGFSTTGTNVESVRVPPFPGQASHEYAGYSTNGNPLAGSLPKWSFYSTLDWTQGSFSAVVGNTFRSSMVDIASGANPDNYLAANPVTHHVASYITWDGSVSYNSTKLEGF